LGLESYKKSNSPKLPSEELAKKILIGLSQKAYRVITIMTADSFGLSQSSVSRVFIEESSRALSEFERRDLSNYDFIVLVIDGKYLQKEGVVIALGITIGVIKFR